MNFDDVLLADIRSLQVTADINLVGWTRVSSDSRDVTPGTVFVAINGTKLDGHDHIPAAIEAGAVAIVGERREGDFNVPFVLVQDSRRAVAVLAAHAAGWPTEAMLLIGITGTDGKTSTSMLIEAGLKACDLSTGLLGTIVYRYRQIERVSNLTTPDPIALQNLFADMRSQAVDAVVMETSSHSIAQNRIGACAFDCAVFTNLSRDHIDFHGTVKAYADAKMKLFSEILPSNPGAKGAVINGDDALAPRIKAECPLPVITWSNTRGGGDIYPERAIFTLDGIEADLVTPWGRFHIRSKLIGRHNLENIMAAIGVGGVTGMDMERYVQGVCSLSRIPGRLELVTGTKDIRVFVDYAHTPKALENVLTVLRPAIGDRSLTVVMGAGGDRDRGKRPLMGRAAVLNADRVIVTSDNPRSERPEDIIAEILSGIEEVAREGIAHAPYMVVADRREAIREAIENSVENGVVVIAGKGHEDYQIIGDRRLHFSDVETAKEFLD